MSDLLTQAKKTIEDLLALVRRLESALEVAQAQAEPDTKTPMNMCQRSEAVPTGITLRDHFAANAMTRVRASLSDEDFGRACYRIADAMLAAQQEQPPAVPKGVVDLLIATKGAILLGRHDDAYNYLDAAIKAAQSQESK